MTINDVQSLLGLLREKSIRVGVENGRLKVSCSPGAVTLEIRDAIAGFRDELIAYFSGTGKRDGIPVTRSSSVQLSISQQDLWHRNARGVQGHAFNVPRAIRLVGPLNVGRLSQSIIAVVRRHAVLRTNVILENDIPVPLVRDPVAFEMQVVDLAAARDPEFEACEWIKTESSRGFDLADECLFRAALLRFSDTDSILHVTAHHLVADCWSLGFAYQSVNEPQDLWHPGLFFSDLFQQYDQGRILFRPEEESLQFSDFANWESQMLQSGAWSEQRRFWKGRWERSVEKPLFPGREARNDYRGRRVPFLIPQRLSDAIRTASAELVTSAHALMLTAFQIALRTWKNCAEIPIGLPVANRRKPEFQTLIGNMGNNILVRSLLPPELTFLDAARIVQRDVIESCDNQEYPIEELLKAFNPDRSLIEVRFIMQTPSASRTMSDGLEVRPIPLCRGIAKYPLSLVVVDQPGRFRGWGEFLDDCLDESMFIRFVEAFLEALEVGIRQPARAIGDFPESKIRLDNVSP
jgi:hypothetical protein